MASIIELYLGNKIYSGWKELNVTRSIEEVSGQFSLGVTVNTADSPLVLKAGAECKLEIDGWRVITGYVDSIDTSVDDSTRTITITGRDKTGDLVDCAAIHGRGQWRNVTLEAIANDLCKPFGVAVRWAVEAPEASAKFKQWQIEPGETVFDNLSRAARHRGVLLTSNPEGDLVFITAGTKNADTLILGYPDDEEDGKPMGTKILSISTTLSWMDRFSVYCVKGDSSAGGLWGETQTASQSTSVSINVVDPEITRYRPTIILADDNFSKGKGNARGSWEQKRAMAHATTANVTVLGWFNRSDELWQPNQLVTLKAPAAGFDEQDLLIITVTLNLTSDGGTVSELELMPRDGFDEPAQPEGSNSNGNGGLWS